MSIKKKVDGPCWDRARNMSTVSEGPPSSAFIDQHFEIIVGPK